MQNLRNSLLLLIFLNISQTAFASVNHTNTHSDSIRKPYYRAWVHSNDESKRVKGFVYQTTDSSLVLVEKPGSTEKQSISVTQISKVAFRRGNNPGLGALAGAGIAVVIGAVWGYSEGDDNPDDFISFSASDKALLAAILLFPVGLVVGFGLGFIKKRRKLSGSLQKYEQERAWIKRFTLTKK